MTKILFFRLFLFIIAIPVMAMYMLGIVFNLPTNLPIGIVNSELNCMDHPINTSKCIKKNLSCRLINEIKAENSLKIFLYDSSVAAYRDGKAGKLNTILELPKNFTEILVDRLDLYDNFDDDVTEPEGISDIATIHLDNTHLHLTQFLQKNLNKAVERFFKKFLVECGLSERLARVTGVVFEEPIYGSKDASFKDDLFTPILLG